MKSVGDLSQFVREHMLEPFDVETRITYLVRHFDDLSRAHEAVLKTKQQLEILEPLVADGLKFEKVQRQIEEWQAMLEALPGYVAQQRVELLTARLATLREEAIGLGQQAQAADDALRECEEVVVNLQREVEENGGQRLSQIGREIAVKEEEKDHRKARWDRYCGYLEALDLTLPPDAEGFVANRQTLATMRTALTDRTTQLGTERSRLSGDLRDEENRMRPLHVELESLKKRKSNIPGPQVEIRRQLARGIGAHEADLPFVGELIQVHEGEEVWEGAIERLLHNFGLSLLVPEDRYRDVVAWVEKTPLNGRLVYYRVPSGEASKSPKVHPQSVVQKIGIQPNTPFYAWLENQLAARFDYACAASLEDFRRETWAITPAGQIKGRDRHEKDDRHRIHDRTRFVLGWDNRPKIAALERECRTLEERIVDIQQQMAASDGEQRLLETRRSTIDRLGELNDYRELDWGQVAAEIAQLYEEKVHLEQTSDVLRTLQQQLEARLRELDTARQRQKEMFGALGANENQVAATKAALEKARLIEEHPTRSEWTGLEAVQRDHFAPVESVEDLSDLERRMRVYVGTRIREASRQREALWGQVTSAMAKYKIAFPVEAREMDARVEAVAEYRAVMERLKADDLPRFEEKFKILLNENTIREIVHFQAQLAKERDLIRERVEQINGSLAEVEYNRGRYIRLDADQNPDREVREFQQQLRAATEGTLTGSGDDQYSEAKFHQVKAIVERFRGREGAAERDRLWTAKVTDVRNEFTFSASERWLHDDTEYEHYTDSGGKSGGQKEKLAYTILAASLAYQFGLDGGNPRSFRFVVIDEAFGRGSDESAQFGLELFRHLNLQLLIVTPLQKIHVIEPYVASVGFVHNVEGRDSQLRNVSIEEYRVEREARKS